MGATYTRQSSSTIVDGATIEAAHFNDEFDQLVTAFAADTGHTHDGTSAEGGDVTKLLGTAITIGDGTAGTDIAVTFDGESNDGVLTWMEDEDYFKFSDDILINSTEKLMFQDTGTYIYSNADGDLDLVSDGTNADAIKLASAGGVTIDAAADITLDAGGGDVFFKDDGTTFGSATNTSGNLIIKSGTTTALTFSGANATLAGDLTISGDDLTMGTNTSGAALIADGTNFNPVVISGDIAISTAGVAAIGSGVIVAADIASSAVTTAKINADAVTGAKIADDAIDSEHYTDGSIDTAHLANDAVTGAKVADDAIDSEHYTNASIDTAHYAAGSVDTTALGADAVTAAKIADDAIDSEHYTDGSIDNAHIADDAIDSEHYAAGSIDTAHLGDLQVTTAKIAADAITSAKIADDALDSEHYTDGSIDSAHLAADAVTGAKIADDAIDSEHYTDGSIDNAHIADDAIDSEHYAAGSIDTAHIADNQITLAKMAGGTDGNIISYDASGDPVAIATGNDGQVLTSTGAGSPPAFEDAGGGGGTVLISSILASGAASVDFDSALSSTYTSYLLVGSAINPATSDQQIYLRFSSDGGSSWDDGASDYSWVSTGQNPGGGANNAYYDFADTVIAVNGQNAGSTGLSNAATSNSIFHLWISDPSDTTLFTTILATTATHGAANENGVRFTTGNRLSAAAMDSVQIFMESGNIDGRFNLYGLADS